MSATPELLPYTFRSFEVGNWHEARDVAQALHGWIFRGSSNADVPLETTLYRASGKRAINRGALPEWEALLLHQFQRRAHHYVKDLPRMDDIIEWLALIQHHGGPTRLLDFSFSFYIAAFFAIEKAKRRPAAAVWAVNPRILKACLIRHLGEEALTRDPQAGDGYPGLLNEFLNGARKPCPLVIHAAPERMNERLSIQQGLFLVPCDLRVSFEQNLATTFNLEPPLVAAQDAGDLLDGRIPRDTAVVRIRLPAATHSEALRDLYAMNVTSASLFPGLDGFARSLYHEVRIWSEK